MIEQSLPPIRSSSVKVVNETPLTKLHQLSVNDNANRWWAVTDSEGADERRLRIAALYGLAVDHPDIQEYESNITPESGSYSPLMARTLVRTTLDQAESQYSLAVDPLTGLKTEREYNRFMSSIFGGKQRSLTEVNLTKVKGDVNNFKRINDVLGELVGDRVLRAAAREVTSSLRMGDNIIAARPHSGGDEIWIAAVGLSPEQAKGLWRRLSERQLDKIDHQSRIWDTIQHEIHATPEGLLPDICVEEREEFLDEETFVLREMLSINGRLICKITDLAVVDLGYSTGIVTTEEQAKEIDKTAMDAKDAMKRRTRDRIEAYRPNGIRP